MTDKQKYWIRDAEGVSALVEGAEQRDMWTKVRGWSEADEPGPNDQVWVANEHPDILPGRLPFAAIELHAGLGWSAGPPPELEGTTKDPALVGQVAPASDAAKPTKAPAVAGVEQKEK
jgi:hypothetical protein